MNDDNQAGRREQIREGLKKIFSGLTRIALMAILLYLVFKYFVK